MLPQVTAAALVSENKQRAYPASVDSIPTSANQGGPCLHGRPRRAPSAGDGRKCHGGHCDRVAERGSACDFHEKLMSSAPLEAARAGPACEGAETVRGPVLPSRHRRGHRPGSQRRSGRVNLHASARYCGHLDMNDRNKLENSFRLRQSFTGGSNGCSSFNQNVARLPVYNAGMNVETARSLSGRTDIVRLGSNENPFGCSPAVMRALTTAAFEPWRYSDPACRALRTALSMRTGAALTSWSSAMAPRN